MKKGIRKFRLARIFLILNFICLSGCAPRSDRLLEEQNNGFKEAAEYANQAQDYYQRAVDKYQQIISKKQDLKRAYFELGLLYYQHAEYELAAHYLSKTANPQADKYLALSLYRGGDFSTALAAFKKIAAADNETLYYYAELCEALNLYDQALGVYRSINAGPFLDRARERINLIARLGQRLLLEDLPYEIQEAVNTDWDEDAFADAGALILIAAEEVKLTLDKKAVFSGQLLIKILNERGKRRFSEIEITYDSTYEKVELKYARIIRPDGVVIPVGERHIRDVSKYLNFPLYSNVRARIISFPEISIGSVIEYKYELQRSQLINEDDFFISYRLQESEPVIRARFELAIPEEKQLNYKILNSQYNVFQAELEPLVSQDQGYRRYLWQFQQIPAIIPEADMPSRARINPIILLSTFESWQAVYDWWWKLSRDKMQADEEIKKKVAQLIRGKTTVLDKARAIYNFCAEGIRYVAIAYGSAGYEPHAAADIFFNKYGDCKDQTILLVTMLKEAGLEAYPVLIGTDEHIDLQEDFPTLNFNHCIAALKLGEELIFLDPTCSACSFETLAFSNQQRGVLIFTADGYKIEKTPIFASGKNRYESFLELEINPDETVNARRSIRTFGLFDISQRLFFRYSSQEAVSEHIKRLIQRIVPVSRLIDYEIQNADNLDKDVVLNYSFWGQQFVTRAGNLRILPQLAFLDTSSVARKARRYPLDLGPLHTSKSEVKLILPAGFKIKYLPESSVHNSPWMDVEVDYRVESNIFYFRQLSRLKLRNVAVSDYEEFKSFIENVSTQIGERVVFENG